MGLFDGDYKMTAQSQREAEVSRAADEAYLSNGAAANGEAFGVSPQVREEAREAGAKAIDGFKWPSARICADEVIKAAIPVIAEAAYKAGLEEAKARIRAAINEIDWDRGLPELVVSQEQEDAFRTFRRAALAAIDKEGEPSE